jgi:amino acid adenylation domain-containing protein
MGTPDHIALTGDSEEAVSTAPGIAIVGMAGRFPGAASVDEFWRNLKGGVDSVSLFAADELEVAKATAQQPGYIGARSVLKDVDRFDAEFFGIYPREAETMDPQHRIFLECAWEALENAGHSPEQFPGLIGVFAGCSMNTYFMHNLVRDRAYLARFAEGYQSASYTTMLGNDKDFLPTRISYKLNLRGPSLSIQTACSTSLVAIAQACQSLLTYGCDMALAGAVSVTFPQKRGYLPEEGGILSTDGKIRPFDRKAQGTVFGHGAGVVLLKRLEDALEDGDNVLAVIRGFAVNNDGSSKAGYTAPSVSGQADVIASAQAMAGFSADTITYIEAHGTGTPLGDPVEVSGLTRAFGGSTDKREFCVLGTAKANVGHLDVASGVVGLIKTVLQMQHHEIPKLLHFEAPNPDIDFRETPFRIPATAVPWISDQPLRAGVSAFGVGGTNAHVVVEEAPAMASVDLIDDRAQVVILSAKTLSALAAMATNLADHLVSQPAIRLEDVASTLQRGRNRFAVRRAFAATSVETAIAELRKTGASATSTKQAVFKAGKQTTPLANPVFLFPGQGAQMVGMGRLLFEQQPVFRQILEEADALVRPQLRDGLISAIYPIHSDDAAKHLNRTEVAQPAIFAVSYALARLWQSIGIEPSVLIGHSIGEFVAATLAGTLRFEDALRLVATRGALMQALPAGAMLAVRSSAEVVLPYLQATDGVLDLASMNAPRSVVVAGGFREIEDLAARLSAGGIAARKLATSHAFHSRMMEPVMADFRAQLAATRFSAPRTPWISTLTGAAIDPVAVTTPDYWLEQLRSPVQFSRAVREALGGRDSSTAPMTFLEVGPGHTLTHLVRQNLATPEEAVAIATLPTAQDEGTAPTAPFEEAIAQLWEQGLEPDWTILRQGATARRIPLPTYPFERKSFWVAPPAEVPAQSEVAHVDQLATNSVIPALPFFSSQPDQNTSISSEANHMPVAPASAVSVVDLLKSDLKALVTELSDLDLSQTPSSVSFMELGLDSLFLTQLTQSIRGKYNVKLTFRQIMGDYSTFDALAEHIAAVAPKAKLPAAAPVAAVASAITASGPASSTPAFSMPTLMPAGSAGAEGYAALFAQQMAAMSALMQQQLAVLQAGGGMTGTPVALAAPSVASTLPATPAPTASAVPSPAAPEKELGTLMPLRPLDLRAGDTLTAKQQHYMTSLIERYNKKTAKSKASAQHYRDVLADPRVASGFNPQFKEVVYPLAVERSAGAYLWDLDGNRYIDILNGYGSIFFGHSPQFVTEAVRHQLDLGFPIGPQTELAGECAELITKLVGMERATFCNTGSEAVMAAMRLARTVTGRSLIVLFAGAYHGQIDEVLVKSNRSEKSIPTAPGIPGESVANMLVLEYGSPHALEVIRRRADEIAAVLVEPIQSRHPELRPKEFLQEIRTITEEAGAALIFDEVVTGFRTHLGGAQQVYGIRADMATYGKVVAGGMPVGVVAGSRAYMDALDGGAWQFGDASVPQVGVTFFAGTFVRHPLTMAAVKATLTHLRDAGTALQDSLAAKTTSLINDLNAMFAEFGFPSKIQHFASWFFFSVPPEARLAKLLYYHLRECGLHLQEGFPCFLTTAHTDADLAEVRATFRHVLEEMKAHEIIGHTPVEPDPSSSRTLTASFEAPITEAQREVQLASQLGAEASCAFNESVSLYLDGPLDAAALEGALNQVIQRHEALRLSVAENGESIVIHPSVVAPLQQDDWRSLSPEAQRTQLDSLLHHEAATPFDLKQAPLFRATLVRLADEKSVLIFTGHHIIVDGWSINVIFDEVGKLYSAARTRTEAKLLPVHSFLDQARTEHAEPNAETEAFWLEQFRTLPPPLELPIDRPRGALREHSGSTLKRTFSKELVTKLRASSAQGGNTLFSTLLSGYFLLLSRLTQQQDLVVGIPMAGQRNFAGESFVGHSVNFLPMRAILTSETTFADLTNQIKNSVYDALDNQEYTLGTLVRKLKVPRNPARLELVEAQFNLEQVGAGIEFDGLQNRLEANPKAAVNADIFFNFVDRGEVIALEVDYNTGLFDAETIDRWIRSLETLLGEAAAHLTKPVSQLRWLDEATEQKILVDWNRTASDYPSHLPVHAIFEQQVVKTPTSIALRQGANSLTYSELNMLANKFARLLQDEHPGKTAIRVALSLDRSPEMIAAILGVLKAGGVYIPIDPTYPAARLAILLEDSQPTLLVTQESLLSNFVTDGLRTLTIESAGERLETYAGENLDASVSAEDPAYIMYTSGSTGNPKGVIVPHRAICRLVLGSDFIHFGAEEVFLQLAPVSFDASTLEIWGALLHGATLALIAGNKPSPEEIGEAIATYGVTTMWLTAALFHLMVMDYLPLLKPLKQLLAGGDVLSVSHVRKALEAMPSLRLVNGYGPTEGTTFTCCHTITLDSLDGDSVPIGRPINNTRVYILDGQGAPVPAGVPGQLHAAGDGLALGYWRAPELTATKFIELDLGPAGKERLYRTGDTARYRADGTILFQGRTDNQVKIRGFRVELGEIEAAAERVPGVRAAIVSARPDWSGPEDIPGDKRLALYFLAAETADGDTVKQNLREYLQSQLPDHMQPAAILALDAFPRTANGKVDYRALPAPKAEQRLHTRPVAEPRTPVEGQLATIWCKVLQLDSVSIHDSIFELGGDSLSIFRITTQANQAGIRMTAKHLFQHKTIAALSPQLENNGDSTQQPVPLRATIKPVSRDRFRKAQSLTNVEQ